jgi:hypothetical protein
LQQKKAKQEAKDAASAVEALGILQVLALLFLILRKSYSRTLTTQYAFINLSVSIPQ